jgi:diguanylate cyclase (GGDEF)-like protein
MEDIAKLKSALENTKSELERTKTELAILYEISNAMRTTLKLDEILYIILTGVTAHIGLGFNRAALFLVNDKDEIIEGKMGIGPESVEEARSVWRHIEKDKMDLDALISADKTSGNTLESGLNQQVRHLKFSLKNPDGNFLVLGVLDGMPLHLTKETIQNYSSDPVISLLKTDELVAVPLKAKDRVNGIILADNFITRQPITKDDIRMLTMLANQAGLAVENSQLYEKTVMRSHSDYLTGLWNHGYFQYLLQSEIEKSKATKQPLSVITLDIDDFKVYNDTLGHQAGDAILRDLASLLRQQSRKMDHVCRYGGEEFTIILPYTDKPEACLIAERIRQDVEKYPFVHKEILPGKKLTVSLGIAAYPSDGAAPSELVIYSDKKLYEAKHQGKNAVCC